MNNKSSEKSLIDYFDTVVKPTVEEFLKQQNDLRRARLACIVLYHTLDYIKYVPKIDIRYITNDTDFIYVRDVCNATKHFKLKRNKVSRKINSTEQIKYHPHTGGGLFTAPFGGATFNNSGIYVETNDHKDVCIMYSVSKIMKILEKEISTFREANNFLNK